MTEAFRRREGGGDLGERMGRGGGGEIHVKANGSGKKVRVHVAARCTIAADREHIEIYHVHVSSC